MQSHHEKNIKMFTRLTEEVVALRKEMHVHFNSFKENNDKLILPTNPFDNLEAFLLFESSIQMDEEKFIKLVRHFCSVFVLFI